MIDDCWDDIENAPTDGTAVLVWAPGVEDLPPLFSVASYDEFAGWCIDELRVPTHYRRLPEPPANTPKK